MRRRIRLLAQGSVVTAVAVLALATHAGGQQGRVPPPAKESVNACLPQTGSRSWCGDGDAATSAKLAGPSDVAVAPDGDLLIADTVNNVIRRVGRESIVSIGGTGERGRSLAALKSSQAGFAAPEGVAAAADGSVLVADTGNDAVRSISVGGVVTTLLSAEGPRRVALDAPRDVVALADGGFLVADSGNDRVLRVTDEDVTVVAGTGEPGFTGDGGPAQAAQLRGPAQITVAGDGSVFIADAGNDAVRRVDPSGTIVTMTRAVADPVGVYAEPSGRVLVSSATGVHAIAADGSAARLAGGANDGYNANGGKALDVLLDGVAQIAPRGDGGLLLAERDSDRIRLLDATRTVIATVAGSGKPVKPLKLTIPRRPFPSSLRLKKPAAAAALVARGAQSSNCDGYKPGFATFNLVPATSSTLTRKARRKLRFSFRTSKRANVLVELYRNGKRVVRTRRNGVPVDPKAKSRRISVTFQKGKKIKGDYVIRLWGVSVGNGVERCDSRRVSLR
jgi:hypothetical protein